MNQDIVRLAKEIVKREADLHDFPKQADAFYDFMDLMGYQGDEVRRLVMMSIKDADAFGLLTTMVAKNAFADVNNLYDCGLLIAERIDGLYEAREPHERQHELPLQ